MRRKLVILTTLSTIMITLSVCPIAVFALGSGVFIDSGQNLGTSASWGIKLGDLDDDSDLDAFVTNFDQPNKVWLNDGTGNFSDSGQSLGNWGSRGIDLGDLDGDGDLDAFVTNDDQPNKVWVNQNRVSPEEPVEVGGEVYPVDKLNIMAPWVALAAVLIVGVAVVVRRRRAQS